MSAPLKYYFLNERSVCEKRGALIRGRCSLNIKRQKGDANSRDMNKYGTPLFHQDLSGKKSQVRVAKRFLFLSTAHIFHIVQKSDNPNNQFQYSHREIVSVKTFRRNFNFTLSECSMFTFIIVEPVAKFGSYFPNVESYTANFAF